MEFKNVAKERYSCRHFSNKEVEEDKIKAILEIARWAPTAVNRQPFKIFVMNSQTAKEKVRQSTNCAYDADTFLIVGYQEEKAWVREFDQRNFADVDGSIIATHLMLAIHDFGLATTWVGHFDAPFLRKEFPEMKEFELIALFPIGYPAKDGLPSPRHYQRKSIEDIVEVL
ncbi:MAG: nitroreductase family protein [Tissierellia bacterium]|nr:nitroreductase family protein [Tissierellia bacterium]